MPRKNVSVRPSVEREINYIVSKTCEALNVDPEKVKSNDRHRQFTEPRLIIIETIRKKFDKDVPYIYIANLFGRKYHRFAFDYELWCKELKKCNKEFKQKYDMVVSLLSPNVNIA